MVPIEVRSVGLGYKRLKNHIVPYSWIISGEWIDGCRYRPGFEIMPPPVWNCLPIGFPHPVGHPKIGEILVFPTRFGILEFPQINEIQVFCHPILPKKKRFFGALRGSNLGFSHPVYKISKMLNPGSSHPCPFSVLRCTQPEGEGHNLELWYRFCYRMETVTSTFWDQEQCPLTSIKLWEWNDP